MLLLEMDFAFGASAMSCNVGAQCGMDDAMGEVARLDGAGLKRLFATALRAKARQGAFHSRVVSVARRGRAKAWLRIVLVGTKPSSHVS